MLFETLHPFILGFMEGTKKSFIPFDNRTAWLIAAVMILLIIGSAVGKLLERSSEERFNSAVVRSFNQRIRSWWLMCAILIAGLVIGPTGTVVLFGMIAFWALREFITMTPTRRGDHRALFWVLVIFTPLQFVLVGLNDERQMFKVLLPIIAAVGGMLVPALFYVFINFGDSETMNGWAIPSATDIAFSLGVLSLLGKRVPLSLKVFLTALAIIDDLGAIVIIALFYSGDLSVKYLSLMLLAFLLLLVINKFNIKKFLPYLIIGIFLWDFTHNSGIHATIAGVLLAMTIPHRKKEKDFSLLIKIEHAISPYVAFGIMPLFAFANAGVSLEGLSLGSLLDKVPLGIVLGLFLGKQLGVFVFSYVAIKTKIAQMPNNTSWYNFYGVGVLTGIGFTMSLFVGNLAFVDNMQYMDGVKIGVLTGSLLSTLFGYFLILLTPNK